MKATRRIFQSHEKEIPPDRKRCHRRSVLGRTKEEEYADHKSNVGRHQRTGY